MKSATFLLRAGSKRFFAVAGLLLMPAAAPAAGEYFVATNDGVITATTAHGTTAFEIAAEGAEAVTFNAARGHIWVYGRQRLQVYHTDGRRLVDRRLPELPSSRAPVDILVGGQTTWLAVGEQLYRFNEQGRLLARRRFRSAIHALSFDAGKSQVLVATLRYVIVLDDEGREVERIRTRLPNIA